MSSEEWTFVARVQGDMQAEILRGLLEAQEIPVLLSREGAGRAIGLTVGTLGEVEILVPKKYSAEAKLLLTQYKRGDLENNRDQLDQG